MEAAEEHFTLSVGVRLKVVCVALSAAEGPERFDISESVSAARRASPGAGPQPEPGLLVGSG